MKEVILYVLLLVDFVWATEKLKFLKNNDWSPWQQWTSCSKQTYCYSGTRYRQRKCLTRRNTCVGIYMESENCPVTNCKDPPQTILSDISEASTSSFISQECDTDIKYSVSGTHAHLLPKYIRKYFDNKLKRKFESGYFNIQNLMHAEIENVTKYCFEPWHLTFSEANTIYRFNRTTKSSLAVEDEEAPHPESLVAGISIVLSQNEHSVVAVYFAIKSSKIGYKNVFYRRWRGMSYDEFL